MNLPDVHPAVRQEKTATAIKEIGPAEENGLCLKLPATLAVRRHGYLSSRMVPGRSIAAIVSAITLVTQGKIIDPKIVTQVDSLKIFYVLR